MQKYKNECLKVKSTVDLFVHVRLVLQQISEKASEITTYWAQNKHLFCEINKNTISSRLLSIMNIEIINSPELKGRIK